MGVRTITIRRAVAGVAAAAAVSAVALVATTGPSLAAPMGKGRIMLCSQGTYGSLLAMHWPDPPGPAVGGIAYTFIVPRDSCMAWNILKGVESIEVRGQWNTSVNQFTLGWLLVTANTNPGVKVYTGGSTADHAKTAYFRWTQA
ncbi:hypothetical protein [Dactylosporangium sp. CA-233914]|uniref:hypothetical protein n=1 Tax=Dactylosporangium sp. CA-233914 TaxID=3239934 RepID=UPI003D8DFCA4